MPLSDPTVRSQELGEELRALREAASWSLTAVGRRIDASASKISRIESGYVTATPEDVAALLVVYSITGPRRRELLDLAREAEKRGWWQRNRPDFPEHARTLVSLEAKAETIVNFETSVVPGLLQISDYTRSIMADAGLIPAHEVESRTIFRQERQAILKQKAPPTLLAILDEPILHRPIGGPRVFRRQLLHLVEASTQPNITILVVPNDGRAHAGLDGSFALLRSAQFNPVVFTGNLASSLFLEDRSEIERYTSVLENLSEGALDERGSVELITALAHETDKEASTP